MAMNKKEQAEFAAAKKAVIVARALNWSEPVSPDVPPPSRTGKLSTGWLPISSGATVACSSPVSHGVGRVNGTTSQRSVYLYSTKLLALRARRHELEKECAEKLATIDIQIQAEKDLTP